MAIATAPSVTPTAGVNSAVNTNGSAVAASKPKAPPVTTRSPSVKPVGTVLNLKVISAVSPALRVVALLLIATPGASVL
ncbi:hypothetical protein DUPY_24140 [Duganella phyllosphaerae]|uniref:Uncharacterized protein n=1 Tax=Duganella phyllosphaerae TaxID=762836 RepID=A0A1E7WMV6_9BURK|nr:hypothetical protein DUPY_24140 [Duganella phyllosphaerae]